MVNREEDVPAEDQRRSPVEDEKAPLEDVSSTGVVSHGGSEGPQSDDERLQMLEELYSTLEDELEGDLDQENTSGS